MVLRGHGKRLGSFLRLGQYLEPFITTTQTQTGEMLDHCKEIEWVFLMLGLVVLRKQSVRLMREG